MACVVCGTFQILVKNGVLIVFLMILTWMCAYGHEDKMVTRILLDFVSSLSYDANCDGVLISPLLPPLGFRVEKDLTF
jgi:hypothetical protein